MPSPIRVAVVGAGSAGLCALRYLSARPATFAPTCYEQTATVGGTWVYRDRTDTPSHPIHTSMYRDLITNLPKELMEFADFPYPDNLPSFVHNTDVRKYLQNYCDNFALHDYIMFNRRVVHIQCIEDVKTNKSVWKVTTESTSKSYKDTHTHEFDAVMVCNGHNSVPNTPHIPGQDNFHGEILHSHDYRTPEQFSDRIVLCLGGGDSGIDIALQLSPHATRVILSHNQPRLKSSLPGNVIEKVGVKQINNKSVVFFDDTRYDIDVILYCTGYNISLPFLPKDIVRCDKKRVYNLYKHLIHTRHTSLSFVGVVGGTIVTMPVFDLQVRYVLATLDGSIQLPSVEEMEQEIQYDCINRETNYGLLASQGHKMEGNMHLYYISELCSALAIQTFPGYITGLFTHVNQIRERELCVYKTRNFRVTGQDTFEEL